MFGAAAGLRVERAFVACETRDLRCSARLRMAGAGVLLECSVVAGDTAFPARIEGAAFVADVALDAGDNAVYARCNEAQRGLLRSQVVRHTVKLTDAPVARARITGSGRDRLLDVIAELRRVRPDALLLAEASARDRYYEQAGFDAAYDWTETEGQWAWRDVFTDTKGVARRLHAAIEAGARQSPPERVVRFLNNNDTGERFITRHGEPMTRVATAALLTLPGVPCLFMFDEVGAEFLPYEAEAPITPPERTALRSWHARLIALRRGSAALQGAGFLPLHVGVQDEAYVYLRTDREIADQQDAAGADRAIVALNFGPRAATVRLALPSSTGIVHMRDLLGGAQQTARSGVLKFTLPPWGVKVLQPP